MSSESKRRLIKPADAALFAAIALLCAALFFAFKSGGEKTAVISVDGVTVRSITLDTAADEIITLNTDPVVTLKVENGTICFIDAKCPDRTCEKSGILSKNGDTAACLPAKTVVTITGKGNPGNGGADAVAF